MIRPFGLGVCRDRDYGFIEKCPHCNAVNIKRITANQITCGKITCREKQNAAARRLREARQRRA